MKKVNLLLVLVLVVTAVLVLPSVTLGAESNSYEGVTKGPNGEPATPIEDIVLTVEEYQQLREGNYKAALLWAGSGEWYNALTEGAKAEFEKMGIEVVAISDAQFNDQKQAMDVETVMALDPDIILALPVDTSTAGRIFKPAVDAGVTLVFVDNGADGYTAGDEYVGIVTGDHYAMGRAAADLMAEALGGKGEIGYIFYDASYYVTNNRDRAFKSTIENKYPDIEIVAEQGFTQENATGEVTSAMLIRHPEIDGIYVSWDVAAEPVVAELRAAGRDDVKVVTHDLGSNNDLDMALGGNVYAKVADMPYQEGQAAARLAAYDLLGKEAPAFVVSDIVIMTRDNIIESYKKSLNTEPNQMIIDSLKQKK